MKDEIKNHIDLCRICVANCACRDCKVNGVKPDAVGWYDYCLCGYDDKQITCESFKGEDSANDEIEKK